MTNKFKPKCYIRQIYYLKFMVKKVMKNLKRILFSLVSLSFISSCSSPATNNPVSNTDLANIFSEYKTYTKINDTLKLSSQHGGKYVFTYFNSKGIDSFRNKKFPYSDGSISVKQAHGTNDPNSTIDTIYVMKKMSGFDSANGDWFYAMLDSTGKTKDSGKIPMCMTCHQGAKDKDYIFGFDN